MALQPDLGPVARRGHRPRLSRIGYARALGDKYGAGGLVPHRVSGSAAVLRSAPVTQDPVLSSWQGEYLNSTKSLGAYNPIMIIGIPFTIDTQLGRSEERRVGKECRSR